MTLKAEDMYFTTAYYDDDKHLRVELVWSNTISDDKKRTTRVITFPTHIKGKPIAVIDGCSFYSYYWPSLKKVRIPRGVELKCIRLEKGVEIEYY